jgi:general secretion pathway protein D
MSLQRYKRRVRRLPMTAAAAASLFVSGGLAAHAQRGVAHGSDQGGQELMLKNVNLVSAPLSVALRIIEQQAHIEYVLKQGQYDRVNVSISQKPVSEALHMIAEAAGADIWLSDGVYIVGPRGSAPRVETPPPAPIANAEPQGTRPLKIEKFYLKFTPPHRMLRMLGLAGFNPLDPNDQFELAANRQFVEGLNPPHFIMMQNTPGIQVLNNGPAAAQPAVQVPTAAPVGPAAPTGNASPLGQNATQPAANNGGSGNFSNSNNLSNSTNGGVSGDQTAQRDSGDFQNFNRGQGAFGGGQGFGGQAGGQPGGAGQPPAGQGAAAGFLQGISPQDIFALDADNSLVLRYDDPQQILNLQEVLRVLDVKPRQIQIKAEFVTVTQNDVSSFGLNFNFTKVNLLAGANLGYQTANTAFIQYATGNLQTQLSFILTQGRGKVVASPLATTLNGVAAQFTSTQNIPVLISQAIVTNNGPAATTSQIVLLPVTVALQITPRINGDDSITLQGQVVFSDVTGSITNPAGGTIPITIQQPVTINRIVRNGDSMVIAGLTRKRDNVSTNKVPLLGDLPLIGTLFRSRNVTTDDSELVVFITPTIIPDRPIGGAAGSGVGSAVGAPGGAAGLPPVGGGLMP